jgi:hypothetical protein
VDPILMNPTGVDRTFRAEFFDVAGNSATQDITVHLDCSGAGDGTCGSACESFSGDYQCGACDRACPNEATCSSFTCRWLDSQSTRGTCNDLCQAQGRRCFDDIGPAGQGQYDQPNQDLYVSVALCTDIPAPSVDTSPFVAMTCWCYEPRPSWYADL